MTRSRTWYVQLAFGFFAMLASMGLVDRYITPAIAATPQIDSTADTTANSKPVPGRMKPKLLEYWIGIHSHAPLPSVLRAHVNIPEGQGVLVINVVETGPGSKAGLKADDILITIGKTPLRTVQNLVDAVEASHGKPLKIELLRDGKPILLIVDPQKRPKKTRRPKLSAVPTSPDMAKIQRWFEQTQPGQGHKPSMQLRFFHPGTVIPPNASIHPDLPTGLSISITWLGKEPAKIFVKSYDAKKEKGKKKQTWKVTENELDQLPNNIRAHVERKLNGVIVGAMTQFDFMPSLGPNQNMPIPKNRTALEQQWREEMQQMQQQMQQLMELMRQRMQDPIKPIR